MSDPEAPRPALHRIAVDALSYPFVRFGWWVLMTGCACILMALLVVGGLSMGRMFGLMGMAALIVRCYLTVVENTITGFGLEAWQNDGIRTEGMYGDLASMLGIAACSWLPAFLAVWFIPPSCAWALPATTLLEALGCEYFCMAVMGLVVMGGTQGAVPSMVIPAITKSGNSYALASILLISVPWSFRTGFNTFGAGHGVLPWIAAAGAAAFLLIMQARLVGLVYLENKERIGWE